MIAYVPVEIGGHRATPRHTVHSVYGATTRCGLYPRRSFSINESRPQGEIKVCGRCFTRVHREELERKIK